MKKIVTILWLLAFSILSVQAFAQLPDRQLRVHHTSNIWFSITNFGVFGSGNGSYPDDEGIFNPAPGAEFPGGSNINYLYQGSLWVGAIIDTINQVGQPILDTLVSIGNDGWWGDLYELFPAYPPVQSMWRDCVDADEEIFAIYSDTCTNPAIVPQDPNDGRPHIPLGITVHQHSRGWRSTGYNELFIIDFEIENIYNRPLHNAWIGLYYDGDVYHSSEDPYGNESGAQDDLCGFIQRGSNRGVAWIADNDGQPYNGQYDYRSPRNVMGMTLLHPLDAIQTNFNWWISNTDPTLDWGPRLIANGTYPFPGGGMGTPGGDVAKYKVMSNGEHDYDQAWCALSHPGWISPPPDLFARNLANGYDTRYLISFGPMEIGGGESKTVTVAFVGGKNLHNDPSNYANHLQNHETDSSSIAAYYQGLDFSDLVAKADSAYSYYQNYYNNVPPGPPQDPLCTSWDPSHVSLAWRPICSSQLREYRIYRGTTSGQYNPQKITPDNFIDTLFTDYGVQPNSNYYYVITAAKYSGTESSHSLEVHVNNGQPQAPTGLAATNGNHFINLSWTPNTDNDIQGYIIYRGFQDSSLFVLDTTDNVTNFANTGLTNGIIYDYKISALDTHGLESYLSSKVSSMGIGADSGIMVVNANRTGPLNPDYDSITAFYQRALLDYQYSIKTAAPTSLTQLANFSAVIWCRETYLSRFSMVESARMDLLGTYLKYGGKLIVEGTRLLIDPTNNDGVVLYAPTDFRNQYLNLTGASYPNLFTNTEFIGASPHTGWPVADVDTIRANRIASPSGENYGRLFGIGQLIPNDSNEVIYNYAAVSPESSQFNGRPVAVIHRGPGYKTATLEMPLYYIKELASITIFNNILEWFNDAVAENETPDLPDKISLSQNWPNPFNAQTTIRCAIPRTGFARVNVYNILGQKIATLFEGSLEAGQHNFIWNASAIPSGLYFARLDYDSKNQNIKMLLLK